MTSVVVDTGGPGLEFDSNGIKNKEVRKIKSIYLLTNFTPFILI